MGRSSGWLWRRPSRSPRARYVCRAIHSISPASCPLYAFEASFVRGQGRTATLAIRGTNMIAQNNGFCRRSCWTEDCSDSEREGWAAGSPVGRTGLAYIPVYLEEWKLQRPPGVCWSLCGVVRPLPSVLSCWPHGRQIATQAVSLVREFVFALVALRGPCPPSRLGWRLGGAPPRNRRRLFGGGEFMCQFRAPGSLG